MVSVNLQGGLGNMLFQIATTISLALDNNTDYLIPINKHVIGLQGNNGNFYKNNIFRNLNEGSLNYDKIYNFFEEQFHYKPINYIEHLIINGYFQSEKYFINNKEYIKNIFSPDEIILNKLNKIIKNEKFISLHIRRGDYLIYNNNHPFIGENYIFNSINYFGEDNKYLVFSDDIEYCKNLFKNKNNFIFIENLTDYESLYLMSLCEHNIISNSTFSWWGSWLNKNENKVIIAPKIWFGPGLASWNTKDIYTDKMIKL